MNAPNVARRPTREVILQELLKGDVPQEFAEMLAPRLADAYAAALETALARKEEA